MSPRPFAAAVLICAVFAPVRAEQPQAAATSGKFTRFVEDASGSRLQTGIGSYRNKDGVTVDLIGAIHIGDKAYYEKLNARFTRYDAMLYEMVGEPFEKRLRWRESRKRVEAAEQKNPTTDEPATPAGKTPAPTEDDRKQVKEADQEESARGNLSWLHPIYDTMEKSLGLTGQMNGIDYRKKNFVHADMSARQFAAMQKKKNESFLTLWWRSIIVQVVHPENAPEQPGLLKIMEILCRKDVDRSLELRRIAARTFGSVEDMLSGIEGEDGSVILTERNKVTLEVLQKQIQLGKKNLAVFYGAAHIADMEKRLLAMGFTRTGGEWFNAWDMPAQK